MLRSVINDMNLSTPVRITFGENDSAVCELEIVSCITVADVISHYDVIDYLEIDIQASEYFALPPALDLLNKKVRWIHLGTHGKEVHEVLAKLFSVYDWDVHVDLAPETEFITPSGTFATQDGVLSLRNPRLT